MPGVSDVVSGKVTAIMNFGAFVLLEDGTSGLVHISEISRNFVRDINDFLSVGQQVRVVSLATDHDGKKRLSIKKADEILTLNGDPNINAFRTPTAAGDIRTDRKQERTRRRQIRSEEPKLSKQDLLSQPPPLFDDCRNSGAENFEDRLSKYMKLSEERLTDAKRQSENKRGGGYIRRG